MINPDQLRADVEAIIAANATKNEKHEASLAASAVVSSTIVTEQAQIDAATAHYELEVGAARTALEEASASETEAQAAEKSALDKLLEDVAAFETPTP
jgi:hypothetical protein